MTKETTTLPEEVDPFTEATAQVANALKILLDVDDETRRNLTAEELHDVFFSAAASGETVTTHREEVRPDGTRVVTTVTETGAVVTKETRLDGTRVTTTTTRTQARQVVTKEQR